MSEIRSKPQRIERLGSSDDARGRSEAEIAALRSCQLDDTVGLCAPLRHRLTDADERMSEEEIEHEVQALCDRRGLGVRVDRSTRLVDLGIRSLDVSELAIHVEERLGRELNLGAAVLRRLDTVEDLVRYMRSAVEAS